MLKRLAYNLAPVRKVLRGYQIKVLVYPNNPRKLIRITEVLKAHEDRYYLIFLDGTSTPLNP